MVASNTTITTNEATRSSDQPAIRQNCANKSGLTNTDTVKQNQEPSATSTTPHSSSSTPSTTSSGKAGGGGHGSTHTMGKFKEKRPEPLNLHPNLNQEIPLDLSVKSAGNMPSGRFINTLETPRIFWLDNEALLIKPRLYSSSTNASQKVKLSSLAGDSPPITPITPFMDMISPTARSADLHQPHSASMLLDSNSSLHSLLSSHYQYNRQQQQQQQQRQNFDDNLLATANKLTPTNRFLVHHFKGNNAKIRTPRRCCSTDSLSDLNSSGQLQSFKELQSYRSQEQQNGQNRLHLNAHNSNDGKKNSISPLVTKNLSSSHSGGCNRFSYSGQQIAAQSYDGITTTTTNNNNDDSSKDRPGSPGFNVTSDQSQSSVDNMTSKDRGKALSPTSVASATSNLLKIHLNSPTNQGPTSFVEGLVGQSGLGLTASIKDLVATHTTNRSPGAESYRSTDQNMDPLISAAYCQQHQQNHILRSSLTSSTSSSLDGGTGDAHHDKQQQQQQRHHNLTPIYGLHGSILSGILPNGFTSLSSSTTLNTPTLISPSQLKSGSSICFLPSPTLSPMSSVFDLPSPLLMFPPPPNQNLLGQLEQTTNKQSNRLGSPVAKEPPPPPSEKEEQKLMRDSGENNQFLNGDKSAKVPSDSSRDNYQINMSLLVTPARDKLDADEATTAEEEEEEVSMDDIRMDIEPHEMISEADRLIVAELKTGVDAKLDAQQQDTHHQKQQQQPSRSGTVIPRILVSDFRLQQHQHQPGQLQHQDIEQRKNQKPPTYQDNIYSIQQDAVVVDCRNSQGQGQFRNQRDMVGKRALSPQSFNNRVSVYRNERLASNSAPPDVYQSRARSKIKSATETCVVPEPDQQHRLSDQYVVGQPQVHQLQSSPTQVNYHYKTNAPYPDLQPRTCLIPLDFEQPQSGLTNKTMSSSTSRPFSSLRPSSAEPYCNRYSLESQQHFEVPNAASTHHLHQQHHLPHFHHHQQQLISSHLNTNFSQSEQHIRTADWIEAKPTMSGGLMVQQHCQSASVGQLNRFPMNCGSFASLTTNQLAATAAMQQQQQHQQQQEPDMPLVRDPVAIHNMNDNHLQSQIVKLDDMIHQSPVPIQIEPNFSSNQLASATQGQDPVQFQGCETMLTMAASQHHQQPLQQQQQHQPRALSADIKGLSRSDSSCSSVDFCFRSSSAASGTTTMAKKYQCDQCAKSFARSDMLTRHKRLHSKERPFQCNECKQEFSRSDHLSTHMRTHTGEKPYKCKLCSYSACRKDMITRHMKVHNRGSPNI